MKKAFLFLLLTMSMLAVTSCRQDEPQKKSKVTFTTTLDNFEEEYQITDLHVTFKEINTGQSYEATQKDGNLGVEVPYGLYDIDAKGTIKYMVNDKELRTAIVATRKNEAINSAECKLDLKFTFAEKPEPGDGDIRSLVIAEIFPSGTQTENGDKYVGDQYFRIYNNSNKVVYADGLLILESSFNTTLVQDIEPRITETCFPVQAVYMVPGSGKDVPVQPGGYLTICDQATDHTKINRNSIDLSGADFEWFDETPANSKVKDVDNPAKNLDKIYCYTRTIWALHDRGGSSYAIAKMGTTKDDYLANYKKKYVWKYKMPDGSIKNIDRDTYYIPTDWVIDGVNLSILNVEKWLVMPTSLDRGFTYVSTIDRDPQRYGKSVVRKTGAMKKGVTQLVDTNNSTDDFIHQSKATLLK